jgi:hypothetical protein
LKITYFILIRLSFQTQDYPRRQKINNCTTKQTTKKRRKKRKETRATEIKVIEYGLTQLVENHPLR